MHSQHSTIDFTLLAQWSKEVDATPELCEQIKRCNTTLEALALCEEQNIPIGDYVCRLAGETASQACPEGTRVDAYCVNKAGHCVGVALSA